MAVRDTLMLAGREFTIETNKKGTKGVVYNEEDYFTPAQTRKLLEWLKAHLEG